MPSILSFVSACRLGCGLDEFDELWPGISAYGVPPESKLFACFETGLLPELEAWLVAFRGQELGYDPLHAWLSAGVLHRGMQHHLLDLAPHHTAAHHEINDAHRLALLFDADDAGESRIAKAVRDTEGP